MMEDPLTHDMTSPEQVAQDEATQIQSSQPQHQQEAPTPEPVYHVCDHSESLESVAAAHGTTPDAIVALNADPDLTLVKWPVRKTIRIL